jgi:hypothetical protein
MEHLAEESGKDISLYLAALGRMYRHRHGGLFNPWNTYVNWRFETEQPKPKTREEKG